MCLICERGSWPQRCAPQSLCVLPWCFSLSLSSVPDSMCLVHLFMCEFWLGRSKAGASCCSETIFGGKRESAHPQSVTDVLVRVEMDGPESEFMTIDPVVPKLLCHVSGWPLQHSQQWKQDNASTHELQSFERTIGEPSKKEDTISRPLACGHHQVVPRSLRRSLAHVAPGPPVSSDLTPIDF